MPRGPRTVKPAPRWVLIISVLLLLVGLSSSLYLGHLYLKVRMSGPEQVQSFCALSEQFNCVTVATSRYSTFLKLPVALYGIEFFALCLAVVLLAELNLWRVRSWEALLLTASALSIPASIALAYVSVRHIHSVCIMCLAVYGVNMLLLIALLVANRSSLRPRLREGFAELSSWARSRTGALTLVLLVTAGGSQFFWVPKALSAHAGARSDGGSDASSRTYHGLPFDGHRLGDPDGKVEIEEFTDFQCPFCGNAHDIMMQVLKQYPKGVKLIHRDFPLDQACNPMITRPFHPDSCRAAVYARCAARQNRYWHYEGILFANRERLTIEDLEHYATTIGLDMDELGRCTARRQTQGEVLEDIQRGLRMKVEGTPTLFINGERVVGAKPPEFWHQKIGELLSGKALPK